ncbi:MAG: beta-lactamase family protein [Methylococcales bacterium]|nr:beta-lactamase family protein [Methylococcales bacterium]
MKNSIRPTLLATLMSSALLTVNPVIADNYFDGKNIYLDEVRAINVPQGKFTHIQLQAVEDKFVLKHIDNNVQNDATKPASPAIYSFNNLTLWIPDIEVRNLKISELWDVMLVQEPNILPLTFTLQYAEKNHEKSGKLAKILNSPEIVKQLESIRKKHNIVGMSVAVTKGKDRVWSRGFGTADIKNNIAVTANTPFRLGSVSKTFLGVAAMQSVEKGILSLDQPINSLLPYPVQHPDTPQKEISIQHLLNHTSGLYDTIIYNCSYYSPDEPQRFQALLLEKIPPDNCNQQYSHETALFLEQYTSSGIIGIESNQHFNAPPGESFQYSNIGTGLAGQVISLANNESINQVLKRSLFEPLNMVNTGYTREDFASFDASTKNYVIGADDGQASELPYYTFPSFVDGALLSSANDLAKYLSMLANDGRLMNQQIIRKESIDALFTPSGVKNGGESYGLFWEVKDTIVSHGGGDPGVETFIRLNRNNNIGIVVLVNSALLESETDVAMEIADYLVNITHK